MVTEAKPSGEPQSSTGADSGSDIAVILERPEVKAAILKAAAAASDETERTLTAKHAVTTKEWEKVKSGWSTERARHALELKAYEKSADADSLRATLLEVAAEKAEAAQIKEEAQALKASVEREKNVAQSIAGFKIAFPAVDKAFWDKATDRLFKGEARTSDIINEAVAYKSTPQQPGQPTGLSTGRSESVTKDNIDKLHLEGTLPGGDERYRKFLQTGQV